MSPGGLRAAAGALLPRAGDGDAAPSLVPRAVRGGSGPRQHLHLLPAARSSGVYDSDTLIHAR